MPLEHPPRSEMPRIVREAEIPSGIGRGWWPIVEDLQEKLDEISPGWRPIQVKEKFGCYDEQTEVLTREGWARFNDLKGDEEFATLREGTHLEYHAATEHFAAEYSGPMYRLRTRGVDLMVTPNHRLYVAKGTYWNGRHSPAKKVEHSLEFATPDVFFGKNKRVLKGAAWQGKESPFFILPAFEYESRISKTDPTKVRKYHRPPVEVPMEPWLEFLGWFIAEGCVSKTRARSEIAVSANNTDGGEERAALEAVLTRLPWSFKVHMTDRPACVYKAYNNQLAAWLREHVGCGAANKRVPRFVGDLSPRLINLLLRALYQGDGHKSKTAHILTTVSSGLADDVQELILKAGGSSRIYEPREPGALSVVAATGQIVVSRRPAYEVNWMSSVDHCTQAKGLATGSVEAWEDYDGMVYCVSVPNQTLFVRRHGIPVWCGNSLRAYLSPGEIEHRELDLGDGWVMPMLDESPAADEETQVAFDQAIREAEMRSASTCEECGAPAGLMRTERGWLKTICPTCAERSGEGFADLEEG